MGGALGDRLRISSIQIEGAKESVMAASNPSVRRHGNSRARKLFVCAAASAALAAGRAANADGTFDGGEISAIQTRMWVLPINWGLDIAPGPADPITFTNSGDGTVDLGFLFHAHPSYSFSDWVSYTL